MRRILRTAAVALTAVGLAAAVSSTPYAAESHSGGDCGTCGSGGSTAHTDSHDSESGKQGPKYKGGSRGAEHSSQVHKSGTHHHDSTAEGSKSVESRIFSSDFGGEGKGPKYMEGGTAGEHDSGDEHAGGNEHEESGSEHTR